MSKAQQALDLFSKHHNCAQAIVCAYGPEEGLSERDSARIAAPFGGGIGRLGETCGAVTGAIVVLGLRYGEHTTTDPRAKAALYERVRELVTRFGARHGSAVCRDLLGCDLSTPEGFRKAQDRKLHQTLCPQFVRSAAEILEEMVGTPGRPR